MSTTAVKFTQKPTQEQIEFIPLTANGHTRPLAVDRSPQPEQQTLTDDWYIIHHAGGTTRVSRSGEARWEAVG